MQKITKIFLIFSLLLVANASLAADKTVFVGIVPKTPVQYYQQAQSEMDNQLYSVYRVAERLIRANKLNYYPWVFQLLNQEEYKVQAQTAEGNLITLEQGVVYTFCDDASALAFVIAHEMAHQTQKHSAKTQRNNTLLEAQLQEALGLYKLKESRILAVNGSLSSQSQKDQIAKELVYEKEKVEKLKIQLDNDKLAQSREIEYQADKKAVEYMVKAGFNQQGAVKALNFFKRSSSSYQDDSDHPSAANRIWQVKTYLDKTDTRQLKNVGWNNISRTQPLKYTLQSYYKNKNILKKTLIIHTSTGLNQDSNSQFEKLFGY